MRELSLKELTLVSGSGSAIDTVDTAVTTGGAGYAAGRALASAAATGAVNGARAGLYGAIVGTVIGLSAGVYDWYQSSQDGSDYGDGTQY